MIICKICNQQNFSELPEEFPRNLTVLELVERGIGSTLISTKQNSETQNDMIDIVNNRGFYVDQRSLISVSQKSHNSKFVQKFNELQLYCQVHDKNFEAFCYTDQNLLCVDCLLIKKHKEHNILGIEESFSKVKKKVNKKLDFFLQNQKENILKGPSNLNKVLEYLTQNFEFAIKKIELEFEKIFNLVNNKKQSFIEDFKYKFESCKNKHQILNDRLKNKEKSIKELDRIKIDLKEEFTKNQQLSFLISYKDITQKVQNCNKSILKIQDEISQLENIKFYDENLMRQEKKIISEAIYTENEHNRKSQTPQQKKIQSNSYQYQNNCFSYFNKNNNSLQRTSKSKVSRKNKSKKNQNLSQLHKSFNKVAKLSKNLKLKKKTQKKLFENAHDIKSNFELSVLNSEKMSFKNIAQDSNYMIYKDTQSIDTSIQKEGWFQNKHLSTNKTNSLKITTKDKNNKNPFKSNKNIFDITPKNFIKKNQIQKQIFNFEDIKKKKNQDQKKEASLKTPVKKQQTKHKSSQFYQSIQKFSSEKKQNVQNNTSQPLYLLLGGQNESTISLNITFYNPEINKWLISPSNQCMELNKFYCTFLEKANDQILILHNKDKLVIQNLYLSDLQDNNTPKNNYLFELDYNINSFAAFFDSDQFLYIAGGNDGQKIISKFFVINLKKKEILELPEMIEQREEFQILFDQKKDFIYSIGGFNQNQLCLSSAERYNINTQKWEMINPMNCKRRGLQCVCLKKGIFAIGGYDGEKYLSSVEFYDQKTNNWFLVSFMNVGRCLFAAIPDNDKNGVYVFGGFNQKPLNSVEFMNTETNIWIEKANIPQNICMHSVLPLIL